MLMARKRECRAARLWPDVIADLIGDYAEYTVEEKVRIISNIMILEGRTLHGASLQLQAGATRNCIWVSGYVRESFTLSIDQLCESVATDKWPTRVCHGFHGYGFYTPRMSEGEIQDIRGWLAQIE